MAELIDLKSSRSARIHAASFSGGGERRVRHLMISRLRELFKDSKQYVRDRPSLKWTFRALYWSPLYMAFVHYGYTVKYVSGMSMQVGDTDIQLCLFLTTFLRMRDVQPTLNPDSSLGKDLVLFDRVSTKIRHKYNRDDVVALKCV